MKITNQLRQGIANLIAPTQSNSVGTELARDFWRNGPRNFMTPDWHRTMMEERDKYTGYMYGAATRRATKVVMLATYHLKTKANDATVKQAKANNIDIRHPYLDVIDKAPTFENDLFWRALQTWIDIKGVAYLYVKRGMFQDVTSNIERIELLWPNEMTVVRDQSNMEIIGYHQQVGGYGRDIPPHMVIMIRDFNPHSRFETFSMADAALDSQFTLKEAGQSMRTGIRRNRRYPGVAMLLGDEVALDPEAVANFKGNMRGKSKDEEPMFAKSKGTKGGIAWNDMQLDMRKSAIDMVNEASRDELIASTGVSKTILGIEQSGVTRDSSETQEDLLIEYQAMPALQKLIGALNEDYKTHYPKDYEKYGYELTVDSPLGDDKEAEGKEIDNRQSRFELYTTLRSKGYDHNTASDYASGKKTLEEIGMPSEDSDEVKQSKAAAEQASKAPTTSKDDEAAAKTLGVKADAVGTMVRSGFDPAESAKLVGIDGVKHLGYLPVTLKTDEAPATPPQPTNALGPVATNTLPSPSDNPAVKSARFGLKRAAAAAQRQLLESAISKVRSYNNALIFSDSSDVVTEAVRQAARAALESELVTYYRILMPLAGWMTISERTKQLGLVGTFKMDNDVNEYITRTGDKAATSHVDTVIAEILKTTGEIEERLIHGAMKTIKAKPGQTPEDKLKQARKLALDGNGREQIIKELRTLYSDTLSEARAETIARTETNRVYNRAQFEADRQFLTENDLMKKAYKQWITRGDNPCAYCLAKSREQPIPFMQAFAKEGDTLRARFQKKDGSMSVRSMKVGFEDSMAGEIHPNGECSYQLIFK